MDGRADGARHALCQLWPLSLACRAVVGHVFSPHISNDDSCLTVTTKSLCVVVGVPERLGWSHGAVVALHSTIDVKCARQLDCPRELRCTVVPVPTPQAGGVTSHSAIDVKCARRFDCPGELRRMAIPVATRSWCAVGALPERSVWSHVEDVALHSAIDVKCVHCPEELRPTAVAIHAR
jgi:hypothetical protein